MTHVWEHNWNEGLGHKCWHLQMLCGMMHVAQEINFYSVLVRTMGIISTSLIL